MSNRMPIVSRIRDLLSSFVSGGVTNECIVVFQVFKVDQIDTGARILADLARRMFPEMDLTFLIVDQAKPFDANRVERTELLGSPCHLLGGDNSLREFTGYDVGIDYIPVMKQGETGEYNPIVFIANETFHTNYGSDYLSNFTADRGRKVIKRNTLMGYLDKFPEYVAVYGAKYQRWLRSSLIVLQYRTLLRVYPFTVKEIEDDIFSDDYDEFFSDSAALSENYKDFMKRWVLGRDIKHEHFKQTWHSAQAPDDANIEELRLKVKSIICEQLFTARAEQLGYKLTVTNTKTSGYRI